MMIYVRTVHAVSSLICALLLFFMGVVPAHAVFINEIHYDNVNADSGEGIELSGVAGVDLADWSLVLYNGSNLSPYATVALSGVFADLQNGMGVLSFEIAGLQNGSSDGVALVDNMGDVAQFLSYEGTLTADSGVATGMISRDIGVAETTSTPLGYSLQLIGVGREYADFSWASSPVENTFGDINLAQRFLAAANDSPVLRSPGTVSVPAPASLTLFLLGLGIFITLGKSRLGTRSVVHV